MDRGRKIRGTTSCSAQASQPMLSQRQLTLLAISGEPVFPYFIQASRSGRYLGTLSYRLTPTGGSLKKNTMLTSSHLRVYRVYANKFHTLCQVYFCSISSALFKVVSVILAPPIILASSFFLPSLSSGVTAVKVLPSFSSLEISIWVSAKAAS